MAKKKLKDPAMIFSNVSLVEDAMREEEALHQRRMASYREVLARYRAEKAKSLKIQGYLYPRVTEPFQMAIPADYRLDFSAGIGEALAAVKDRFVDNIIREIRPQIREHLGVDPFTHADGDANLGVTIYLLTEDDMMELEDAIRQDERGDAGDPVVTT